MSLRIVFAGTALFAQPTLEALIASEHEICAVVTQPDRPRGRGQNVQINDIKRRAMAAHLPVLQPQKITSEFLEAIRALQPDVLVVVAYGLIIPQALLDIPRLGGINVHGSVLPRWRGAAPIARAIMAGDEETGVTIIQMDAGVDTGDMLQIETCPLLPDDTTASLTQRLAPIGAKALLSTLSELEQSKAQPVKQQEAQACYAHKLSKQDGVIDWTQRAVDIERQVRALTPWPGCATKLGDEVIKVWHCELGSSMDEIGRPGEIVTLLSTHCVVATGEGFLSLLEVQFEHKPHFGIEQAYQRIKQQYDAGSACFGS